MHTRTKVIIGLVLGTLLAVGAAELLARKLPSLQLGNPPLYAIDPELEYMLKPNQDGWRFGNRFHVNQWGMRSDNQGQVKSDKTEVRILLFGDSVPNGGSQTDQDSLATSILGLDLTTLLGRKALVANISAGSWGPPNHLAYVRKYGNFQADAVVLVYSSHDASDWPTFSPLSPDTHPTRKPFSALSEAVTRYLPRYLPAVLKPTAPPTADYQTSEAKTTQTLDSLSALIKLFQKDNIPVVMLHHWEKTELATQKAMPGRDSLRNRANLAGIPFVSDSAPLATALSQGKNPYRDNIHPNNYGQRLLADQVKAFLSTLPL